MLNYLQWALAPSSSYHAHAIELESRRVRSGPLRRVRQFSLLQSRADHGYSVSMNGP